MFWDSADNLRKGTWVLITLEAIGVLVMLIIGLIKFTAGGWGLVIASIVAAATTWLNASLLLSIADAADCAAGAMSVATEIRDILRKQQNDN